MKMMNQNSKNETLVAIEMAMSVLRPLLDENGPFPEAITDEDYKNCRKKMQSIASDLYWLMSKTKALPFFKVGQRVKFDFNGATFVGQVISETEDKVNVRSLQSSPVYWSFDLKKEMASASEDSL